GRDGTLWIGTTKGLASWRDGKLIQYAEFTAKAVASLLQDHEGTVWAGIWGQPPSGRLCAIQKGSVHCEGENGILGYGVLSLYEDSAANLWAGSHTGVWRWKPGPPKFYPAPADYIDIKSLVADDDGSLLVGFNGSLRRIVNDKWETAYSLP